MATGRYTTDHEFVALPGLSPELDDATADFEGGCAEPVFIGRGSSGSVVADVIDTSVLGRRTYLWDGQFFGVIHVIPRTKNLGPIVSQTTFPIEVWNASELPHTAIAYGITGSPGVTLTNGVALPAAWAPFSSVFFDAVVDAEGDPIVAAIVEFVFPGFTGTDCQIFGFRISIFPLAPDWDREFRELFGYTTSLLRARDGSEQRALLRALPVRELAFTGFCEDVVVSGGIMSKLFSGGAYLFAVPYWPDAIAPSSNVAIGATVVNVDTTTRIFEIGGLVILWRDEGYWEAFTISAVTTTTITLASVTTKAFLTAGSLVVPLLVARPEGNVSDTRLAPGKTEVQATFTTEPT